MADDLVVAATVEAGGGMCLTADAVDLAALSAPYSEVNLIDLDEAQ